MSKRRTLSRAALLACAALVLAGCNAVENKTKSATMLTVDSIMGKNAAGVLSNYLESDVVVTNATTGGSTYVGDSATATLRATTLNPNPIDGTSRYEDILVDRVIVSYTRVDGRNTPGVDVPYPFESAVSSTVPVNGKATLIFEIVRATAKLEPPLVALARSPIDEGIIHAIAHVKFCGHDLAGHDVEADGQISVNFADYATVPVDDDSGGAAAALRIRY